MGKEPRVEASNERQGRVLIVDDDADNRLLLSVLLEPEGCETIEAADGPEALAAVEQAAPDVVLLDIMMPGMDGYEVCRRLKENRRTAFIPVVLVTSLNSREDRVRGSEVGADEFITKPVDRLELIARVRALLRLKRLSDEREHHIGALERLEELRDNLTNMIVHDMRSLLGVAIMASADLQEEVALIADDDEPEAIAESMQLLNTALQDIGTMVDGLLDVSRLESGTLEPDLQPVDVHPEVERVFDRFQPAAREASIAMVSNLPDDLPPLLADPMLFRRTLDNLVGNAVKFTPPRGEVAVDATVIDEHVVVTVRDTGRGIPADFLPRVFDKFVQVESRAEGRKFGVGLGLAFCKLATSAQGGQIEVESEVGKGSRFVVRLPLAT